MNLTPPYAGFRKTLSQLAYTDEAAEQYKEYFKTVYSTCMENGPSKTVTNLFI